MFDKIVNLYKTKPVVFWVLGIVLIPVLILLVFKNVFMTFLAAKANETTKDAQLKDQAFKTAINSLSVQAAVEKQKADDLGKQAEQIEVGTDWNQK